MNLDWLDSWTHVALAMVAIGAAMTLFHRKVIKPIVKAAKAITSWWEVTQEVVTMKATLDTLADGQAIISAQVAEIKADIAPTNGDQRSISDRVDTAKNDVKSLTKTVGVIEGRQKDHKKVTEANVRTLFRHTSVDEKNFHALAEWTRNFKEFEPLELTKYEEVEDPEDEHDYNEEDNP